MRCTDRTHEGSQEVLPPDLGASLRAVGGPGLDLITQARREVRDLGIVARENQIRHIDSFIYKVKSQSGIANIQ